MSSAFVGALLLAAAAFDGLMALLPAGIELGGVAVVVFSAAVFNEFEALRVELATMVVF